jgi:hypothetical protein
MANAAVVKVVDGFYDRKKNFLDLVFVKLLDLQQHFIEIASRAVFHHEVDVFVVFVDLVELDDVGMVHVLKNQQFFEELAELALYKRLADRLDGDFDSGLLVDTDADMTIGSTANDLFFEIIVVVYNFFARFYLVVDSHL